MRVGLSISGACEPGMLVRFRPEARLNRDYVLHSVKPDEDLTQWEKRPCYELVIECGTLEETEFLHSLRIREEDIELLTDTDR